MAWRKTAAVVTLAMVPTFAAIGGAMADQRQQHHGDASDEQPLGVAVSASSGDAAWIASQLHQPRFAGGYPVRKHRTALTGTHCRDQPSSRSQRAPTAKRCKPGSAVPGSEPLSAGPLRARGGRFSFLN